MAESCLADNKNKVYLCIEEENNHEMQKVWGKN